MVWQLDNETLHSREWCGYSFVPKNPVWALVVLLGLTVGLATQQEGDSITRVTVSRREAPTSLPRLSFERSECEANSRYEVETQ